MKYTGIVQKGNGTGSTLGFPTANIPCAGVSAGIYAARVRFGDAEYESAVYADVRRGLLEAHLLDFEGDLYGKAIEIELLQKVRDDMAFASEDEARKTIAADIAAVRAYFNRA